MSKIKKTITKDIDINTEITQKVMLRIDRNTCVLVHPKNANAEYAEMLRRKFNDGPDLIRRKPSEKQ